MRYPALITTHTGCSARLGTPGQLLRGSLLGGALSQRCNWAGPNKLVGGSELLAGFGRAVQGLAGRFSDAALRGVWVPRNSGTCAISRRFVNGPLLESITPRHVCKMQYSGVFGTTLGQIS